MSGSLVFTNNVLHKLKDRNISHELIYNVVHYYDKSFSGDQPGTTVFQKDTSIGFVNVIGKRIENNKWLILTFWSKNTNTKFVGKYDSRYKNASFLKRIWLDLISTFGL